MEFIPQLYLILNTTFPETNHGGIKLELLLYMQLFSSFLLKLVGTQHLVNWDKKHACIFSYSVMSDSL